MDLPYFCMDEYIENNDFVYLIIRYIIQLWNDPHDINEYDIIRLILNEFR